MISLRRSDALATQDLRRRVLRPGSTGVLAGDEDLAGVVFVSAYDDGALVATGNVRPEPFPGTDRPDQPAWRLRGMATEPARRGEGLGAAVLAALVEHCRAEGGALLWANARLPALAFYARAGFGTWGQPWVDAEIGPHQMIRFALR